MILNDRNLPTVASDFQLYSITTVKKKKKKLRKWKKKATVTEVGEKEGKWEKIRVVRLARVGCARHRQS